MIITRTPFRISFAGGGSDIPQFYEKNGGCVLSTTINKYMFISLHPTFRCEETIVKYTDTEIVTDVSQIKHRYFNTILSDFDVSGVEITSTADVPAGTGLGSSSSFTVGLLNAIHSYKHEFVSREALAQQACDMEMNRLGQRIGKQDQYAAAYGGLNFIRFNPDGTVSTEPLNLRQDRRENLEKCLRMYYIGGTHSASAILKEQAKNISNSDKEQSQIQMCQLAVRLRNCLLNGDLEAVGGILDENWELKKTLSSSISNPVIDEKYKLALDLGATGGKLLGAGGGGFMLFYVPEECQKGFDEKFGMSRFDFRLDNTGTTVIYVGN